MANGTTNGRAHVLEISNRAAVQSFVLSDETGIIANLQNHESGLNPNAHGVANIGGLQGILDSKEPAFSKNTAFNKNFGTTAGTVCQGNDGRLSDARTPLAHAHSIGDVTGLQAALDGKQSSFSGYTGSVTVITGVNFTNQTTTTKVMTYSNGVLVSVV